MAARSVLTSLLPHDAIIIAFASILSIIIVIFHASIVSWPFLLLANIFVCVGIVILAQVDSVLNKRWATIVHHWYAPPIVFLAFKEMYILIPAVRGKDYDDLLIAIDRWIFGVDPTVWLAQFSHPILTEIVQIAYSSFYFLFLIAGYELYRKKQITAYLFLAFVIVYGFFLSYLGYFMLPAVGPRFTLHDFHALNTELPGLFLTNALREFVNAGGSIPKHVANPEAFTQRDVFPSGHTMMTIVLMYYAGKYRLSVRWPFYIIGVLLIFGTVYLRYHYVIDLIAGGVFVVLCIWTAPKIFRWLEGYLRHRAA